MWLLFGFAATGPLGGMSDLVGVYETFPDLYAHVLSPAFRQQYKYYSLTPTNDIRVGNVTTFAVPV
jgi:hypothetical protein